MPVVEPMLDVGSGSVTVPRGHPGAAPVVAPVVTPVAKIAVATRVI